MPHHSHPGLRRRHRQRRRPWTPDDFHVNPCLTNLDRNLLPNVVALAMHTHQPPAVTCDGCKRQILPGTTACLAHHADQAPWTLCWWCGDALARYNGWIRLGDPPMAGPYAAPNDPR